MLILFSAGQPTRKFKKRSSCFFRAFASICYADCLLTSFRVFASYWLKPMSLQEPFREQKLFWVKSDCVVNIIKYL